MPRILDLFCGAGGAAVGYFRAGFDVIGVDVKPQPHYPFPMIEADALDFPTFINLDHFNAIHASPPCQRYSAAAEIHDSSESHPDLIDPTRELLEASGLPWVMENVTRAPLRTTLTLCGSMFGLGVLRHRNFESNLLMLAPTCGDHSLWYAGVFGGRCVGRQRVTRAASGRTQTWDRFDDELATAREAMGIDWMTLPELSEAIPPAYTQWIGERLLESLEAAA